MTEKEKSNPMKEIYVSKVTVNIGTGEPGAKLDKAVELLKTLTGRKVVKTSTQKRIPSFNLRPDLEIGCKSTVRKGAKEFLKRLFEAVDNKINRKSFDRTGNFSFGVKEYISVPEMEYDPSVGIIGFDVCVTLERPGYRVKKRKMRRSAVGPSHIIKPEEAMEFVKREFGVEVE